MVEAYIVLDIGKTNVKLTALDSGATVLAQVRRANAPVDLPPYRQADVEAIWQWLMHTLAAWAERFDIRAIVPVTHGATAALVDAHGLVLPVLDYEADLVAAAGYADVRPAFAQTCSPALSAGLNLGRQLYWQQRTYPDSFRRASHILTYPQYWAWRLSGVAAGEVTSLGCHTDLWQPHTAQYSSLVRAMGWEALLPPLRAAGATLGTVTPTVAARTGLPPDCRVVNGIHDSNASLLRHLNAGRRVVLSTGTWVIAAAIDAPAHTLDERLDMLANVSAAGTPVSCMRFMGGREFSLLAGDDVEVCSVGDLAVAIARGTMALPCFATMGGPFAGCPGRIVGPEPAGARKRYALATIYCALMTHHCLEHLDPDAPVIVEGSFTANPHFAGLLAALRPGRVVTVSADTSGTTLGGWMLATGKPAPAVASTRQEVLAIPGLGEYARRWRAACLASAASTAINPASPVPL